jgi:hypothetical protein
VEEKVEKMLKTLTAPAKNQQPRPKEKRKVFICFQILNRVVVS